MVYQDKIWVLLIILACLFMGCTNGEPTSPTTEFDESVLSDVSYNFVGLDQKEAVVILGQLNFSEVENLNISGTWNLETWGEQPQFSHLPANGSFSGFIHGQLGIINIDLPETEEFLGLIVEGVRENKLVGSLRLFPESEFSGRFEAIER